MNRVSLRATAGPEETHLIVTGAIEIDLPVKNPDVIRLHSPAHLFYAGLSDEAVVIGQQINPQMPPS